MGDQFSPQQRHLNPQSKSTQVAHICLLFGMCGVSSTFHLTASAFAFHHPRAPPKLPITSFCDAWLWHVSSPSCITPSKQKCCRHVKLSLLRPCATMLCFSCSSKCAERCIQFCPSAPTLGGLWCVKCGVPEERNGWLVLADECSKTLARFSRWAP